MDGLAELHSGYVVLQLFKTVRRQVDREGRILTPTDSEPMNQVPKVCHRKAAAGCWFSETYIPSFYLLKQKTLR